MAGTVVLWLIILTVKSGSKVRFPLRTNYCEMNMTICSMCEMYKVLIVIININYNHCMRLSSRIYRLSRQKVPYVLLQGSIYV